MRLYQIIVILLNDNTVPHQLFPWQLHSQPTLATAAGPKINIKTCMHAVSSKKVWIQWVAPLPLLRKVWLHELPVIWSRVQLEVTAKEDKKQGHMHKQYVMLINSFTSYPDIPIKNVLEATLDPLLAPAIV